MSIYRIGRFLFGLLTCLSLIFMNPPVPASGSVSLTDGTPYLVKDLDPNDEQDLTVYDLVAVNNELYFSLDNRTQSREELWRSNGTPQGTQPIKYFQPTLTSNNSLTEFHRALYFVVSYNEIWRSFDDKVELFKKFDLPSAGSYAQITMVAQTKRYFFFTVEEGTKNLENIPQKATLWRSDGTLTGTILLQSFEPISIGGIWNPFGDFLTLDETVYFQVFADHQFQIRYTDGTTAGTLFWKECGTQTHLGIAGNHTFYYLEANASGSPVLWRTEGKEQGSTQVYEFPGVNFQAVGKLTDVDGSLFFVLNNNLWFSGGTNESTHWIKAFSSQIQNLTAFSGRLLFTTDHELWLSDGTSAGTRLVRDFSAIQHSLTTASNRVYFTADDSIHGMELWQSDGSEAGTFPVKDLNPGAAGSNPYAVIPVHTQAADLLFFIAEDGITGTALWALPVTVYTDFSYLPILVR